MLYLFHTIAKLNSNREVPVCSLLMEINKERMFTTIEKPGLCFCWECDYVLECPRLQKDYLHKL